MTKIFTLVLEVTKSENDDLPIEATGAAFVLFAPADDADEAVREAVKIFREAGLNPLEVSNYGTIEERISEGYEFAEEEMALAEEAKNSNAIIILDKQLFFGDDDEGGRN